MDPHRKLWNANHQKLSRILAKVDREAAIPLFLDQHAMVHSARVTKSNLWSFEDEVLDDMSDEEIRQLPRGGEHSIAWILFHLSRIEDITMNMLVAGRPQIFRRDGWGEKMKVSILHSANKMDGQSVMELSAQVDLKCLRQYRTAVARSTRQIVRGLREDDFRKQVQPPRIEMVMRERAVTSEAMEITKYWSKKTVAGLLLMPPTRHCVLHWNEGMRIKEKVQKEND